MKVFMTGATGFTGSRTLPLLLGRGLQLRCLYRDPARLVGLPAEGVEWVRGDLNNPAGLAEAMRGCDSLINIASLGFGHAPAILQASRQAGISRAVFVSTTAIFTRLNASSKHIRLSAEESVLGSGLAWTILRPTMIYGSKRDRNMARLIRHLRTFPLLPIFGDGEYLMQPVFVDDVACAVADAFLSPKTVGQAYNIAGQSAQTYNQIVDTVAAQLGRKVWKLHLPAAPAAGFLRGLERLGLRLPIKAEQIERLNEDKAFDYSAAARDFGYAPRSFAEGICLELMTL